MRVRAMASAAVAGFGFAFAVGILKRRRNLARLNERRARRALQGRVGPSSWATSLARRIASGELEALFLTEEKLWRALSSELARSPSANQLSADAPAARDDDDAHAARAEAGLEAAIASGFDEAGAEEEGDDDGRAPAPAPAAPRPLASITFSGGGFRTMSYFGQIMYLERAGLIGAGTQFYGCSLGAFFAVTYSIVDAHPELRERFIGNTLDYIRAVHFDWLGMWGLCGVVFERILRDLLPAGAAALARGRAHVAIARFGLPWPLGRGLTRAELVSDFRDNDDLVSALIASQFIPGWTHGPHFLQLFRGAPACDGGLFDNQPAPPPPPRGATAAGAAARGHRAKPPRRECVSVVRVAEHLRPPELDWARGHYTCREEHAPVAQVFRPPPCSVGRVEERLVDELRRGYRAAEAAVTAARSRELAPPPTAALPASASAA